MSETRHGTYLTTSVTQERFPFFRRSATAELFIDVLQHYRRQGHYKLHAFVVMPDHVHLLITPEGITLERAMQFVKGGFSRRFAPRTTVWQKGFQDHRCRDAEEFLVRKRYVHENPVRAGLAAEAHLYPFSSAFRGTQTPSG